MSKTIDKAFDAAISGGVFPAAEVLAAKNGEVLYTASYGLARKNTCFDIASLTKPMVTATLAMMLDAEGLIKLEDTVYQWLPSAKQPAHRNITIRQLLNHTSGLPAWQPYYRTLPMSLVGTEAGREMLLDECKNEPPVAEPGKKTMYSDIGYILLGDIIEHAGEALLDEQFSKRVAKPLNLDDTFFVRVTETASLATRRRTKTQADQHVPAPKHGLPGERVARKEGEHRRFAPTEDCPWRERVMHGQVHDQNAFALGGVAGHAGLFSTADDIHRFMFELTRSYQGKSDWIPKSTVQEFLKTMKSKPEGDAYVLGWSVPSKEISASGHHFSANSIGHLAYTGCSIWADLSQDFWIILLTNRIHPSTTNEKIKAFRPMIHDLIYDELIKR
ncbi:MAG: serine hydrolase domain-containing protein [Pseudomonadota bacterium]